MADISVGLIPATSYAHFTNLWPTVQESTAARASSSQHGVEPLADLLEKLETLSGETVSKIDEAEGRAKALKLELARQMEENARLGEENQRLKEEVEKKRNENEELKGRNGDLERKNRDLEERWNVVQERLGPYNR